MRLYLSILFDRDMSKFDAAPSPGGYEVRTSDGETYGFDFNETDGCVDTHDTRLMHWRCKDEDTKTFPKIEELRHKLTAIEVITECYIDMEAFEGDDWPRPLAIKAFVLQDTNAPEDCLQSNDRVIVTDYGDYVDFALSERLCAAYSF